MRDDRKQKVRRPVAKIYSGSESDLFFLADVLRQGGLVAVPTETVYGLAAHALDAEACGRVFAAKQRPAHDPLIVHVASLEAAGGLARFNSLADQLADAFWPGPLTLVLPKHDLVPDIVTSARPSVAVRIPAHPVLRALLTISQLPLAAPSANPFGYVSPTTAAHVVDGLGDRIDHILDGGPCTIGVESTIIDVRDPDHPVLLRPGGIAREEIEATIGRRLGTINGSATGSDAEAATALAPGMLDRHYSPRTPIELRATPFPAEENCDTAGSIARVFFRRPTGPHHHPSIDYWLTSDGNLAEAARELFALLRRLDERGYDRIIFEPAPDEGLGVAINDRLRRAAAKR